MADADVLNRITEIVERIVPRKLQECPPPLNFSAAEWAKSTSFEKGYFLIRDIIRDYVSGDCPPSGDKPVGVEQKEPATEVLLLSADDPTFFSPLDEDMFFEALERMASFVRVECLFPGLNLIYTPPMTVEEKKYLVAIMQRYRIKVPKALRPYKNSLY